MVGALQAHPDHAGVQERGWETLAALRVNDSILRYRDLDSFAWALDTGKGFSFEKRYGIFS